MPYLAALLLACSLGLATVLGPHMQAWCWGPALLALSLAGINSTVAQWRGPRPSSDWLCPGIGMLTVLWFGIRAWTSPVGELAMADGMLLGAAVLAWFSAREVKTERGAGSVLLWGMAAVVCANLWIAAKQLGDPDFSGLLPKVSGELGVTGFFTHYNEAANFFLATACIMLAAALFMPRPALVRAVWALVGLGALAAVYFTRSRGGILGAACGMGLLAMLGLFEAKARKSKWFAPTLILIPLLGIAVVVFLNSGWMDAQEARRAGADIAGLMDNKGRLHLLGAALSCFATHPWSGGGAQSFGWESYQFINVADHGGLAAIRAEFAHNELAQTLTDYGMIGLLLLVTCLAVHALGALLRIFLNADRTADQRAWWIAGLCALTGMLVQSCFSFVFHHVAGVILLGLCLGVLTPTGSETSKARRLTMAILTTTVMLACLSFLLPTAWNATRITKVLWDAYYIDEPLKEPMRRITALTKAIGIRPSASFHRDRASALQMLAAQSGPDLRKVWQQAADDWRLAHELHPFDPTAGVNLGRLLGYLGEDEEAETWLAKASKLQGGMEPAFHAHASAARHFYAKALKSHDRRDKDAALSAIEMAVEEIEACNRESSWLDLETRRLRLAIFEAHGETMELHGKLDQAVASYDIAVTIPEGLRAHLRASIALTKKADIAWSGRDPERALACYLAAQSRLNQASGQLPEDIPAVMREKLAAHQKQCIDFLRAAKVEPDGTSGP
jgi:tetratricopeptide (TPR) repeat protein